MARTSSGESSISAARRFSSRRRSFVVPGIGTIQCRLARSQASAIWAGVAPRLAANRLSYADERLIVLPVLGIKARDRPPEVYFAP